MNTNTGEIAKIVGQEPGHVIIEPASSHQAILAINKNTGEVVHASPYRLRLTNEEFARDYILIEKKPKRNCLRCGGAGHVNKAVCACVGHVAKWDGKESLFRSPRLNAPSKNKRRTK